MQYTGALRREKSWDNSCGRENIKNGEYAKQFIMEGMTNYPEMTAERRLNAEPPIEVVGAEHAQHDALDQSQSDC